MNPTHPAFSVEIDVSHHYFYQPITDAEAAQPSDSPVIRLPEGKLARKVLREFSTTTTVSFAENSIKAILDDRDTVTDLEASYIESGTPFSKLEKITFNMAVADHLRFAAMRDMAPTDKWLTIRVPSNPNLENYLNTVFELNTEATNA